MEIDIFPIASTKGVHRYIGTALLGLVIITFIIGAYKVAQQLIGEDNELFRLLATIPLFIGGYAVLILLLHCAKQCFYAYFKRSRKELNYRVDRESMDNYIVQHLEKIQKKLDQTQMKEVPRSCVDPSVHVSQEEHSEDKTSDDYLRPSIMPELEQTLKMAQHNLAPFIQQLHIDRIQLTEAKTKHDKEKLERILRYTRLVLLPHGFSDEELYQIEESVKLLVQCNGIENGVSSRLRRTN